MISFNLNKFSSHIAAVNWTVRGTLSFSDDVGHYDQQAEFIRGLLFI